jgi:two-component sensor histidine kinase
MADGRIKWVEERGVTEFSADGAPLISRGTVQDITERRRTEEQLRAALAEKEALLREIHHRVKNNLQITASLLYLQANKVTDPAARKVFEEAQQRLRAMSVVHEQLYRSDDLAQVDLADYVRTLVGQLAGESSGAPVRFDVDTAPVRLAIDQALPAGMILVELVTNVLKHAYPGGDVGHASVQLTQQAERVTLTVSDGGVGLPAGLEPESSSSFGWRIIRMLTAQLGGALAIEGEDGTKASVSFAAGPGSAER